MNNDNADNADIDTKNIYIIIVVVSIVVVLMMAVLCLFVVGIKVKTHVLLSVSVLRYSYNTGTRNVCNEARAGA